MDIPPNPERRANVPPSILTGGAWELARPAAVSNTLWLHQSRGLELLESGRNVVLATPTASGKTLVFQLWAMTELNRNPEAVILAFYPTKALANDQARRWRESCQALGMPDDTVEQIDGDVGMARREEIIRRARVVLATPDVTHAWLLRRSGDPLVRGFLRRLRGIIIDEAHAYEGVFGSNSAYLFRRLISAAASAGSPAAPRFVAATATIQDPEEHLEKLTGEEFRAVDQAMNGSPRHHREVHHLPLRGPQRWEEQLADLVTDIIDHDPEAQVIAFHDSRMGIERMVQRIGRPHEVLPYRSGYLAQDRRAIENSLRGNRVRAVIATSALELGIDMPDLNYGINMDLPPTRKQFHQRLGRVGRTKPAQFVLLAPRSRFRSYGETLGEYLAESVEPSHLYLDNEQIRYQQAQSLKDELERSGRDTRTPPDSAHWPKGFDESLRAAHGAPPTRLALQGTQAGTPPQLANSLRSSGEENLEILDDEEPIGIISVGRALEEAHPGAIYRHRGVSYRVEEWGRRRDTMKAYVRTRRIGQDMNRTSAIIRIMAALPADPGLTLARRELPNGHAALRRIVVTESVEGYEETKYGAVHYLQERKRDPRMSRKQRVMPTTAVEIRIEEGWFRGDFGEPWQARHQAAEALRMHLAYRRSIARQELGSLVENVFLETPRGCVELDDAILVYDRVHGGLGLVEDLYRNLARYARSVPPDYGNEPGTMYPDYRDALVRWAEGETVTPESEPELGPDRWWRAVREGTPVRIFSSHPNGMMEGEVKEPLWRDGVAYRVETAEGTAEAPEEALEPRGEPLDYRLWLPAEGRFRELQQGKAGG